MALLRFTDRDGREWEVWEVGARALPADRAAPEPGPGRGPERWLCFESTAERRRLAAYPARWHAMSPAELDALRLAATPVRRISPPLMSEPSRRDGAAPEPPTGTRRSPREP